MSTSTLTSKGQTTIPQEIRSYLGIHAGDKLEFIIDKKGHVIVTALTCDVTELKRLLPRPRKKVSLDDMNKAIAKRGSKI